MENWIIHDSKIRTDPHINLTNQIRLNDDMECSTNLRSVQIDLGRLMTITGFAYTSNVQTNATLRYGVNSSNLDNFYNVVKSGYSANQTEMIVSFVFFILFITGGAIRVSQTATMVC